jgi:SAM-dependent methyltransferase
MGLSGRPEGGPARSFGTVADAYERGRPGYPLDAIRWLLGAAVEIVELGAGTGKLTRQLVAEDRRVIAAVEPDPELREQLARAVPEVPALAGRAEAIPLQDACADAVAVAQAFHWFEPDEALPEIARVLRPGGTLALLWNRSDKSVAWVQALSRLYWRGGRRGIIRRLGARARGLAADRPRACSTELAKRSERWKGALGTSPLVEAIEHRSFRHEQTLDREGLLALVSSRSFIASRARHEREDLLSRVERLWDEHPDLAGRREITLFYRTDAYRCRFAVSL